MEEGKKVTCKKMEEREGRRRDGARSTHGACNNTTCMNMTMHMMIMRMQNDKWHKCNMTKMGIALQYDQMMNIWRSLGR